MYLFLTLLSLPWARKTMGYAFCLVALLLVLA